MENPTAKATTRASNLFSIFSRPFGNIIDGIFRKIHRKKKRHNRLLIADHAVKNYLYFQSAIPFLIFADVRVFFISIAIVIGPTPPGTGVMYPAFSKQAA